MVGSGKRSMAVQRAGNGQQPMIKASEAVPRWPKRKAAQSKTGISRKLRWAPSALKKTRPPNTSQQTPARRTSRAAPSASRLEPQPWHPRAAPDQHQRASASPRWSCRPATRPARAARSCARAQTRPPTRPVSPRQGLMSVLSMADQATKWKMLCGWLEEPCARRQSARPTRPPPALPACWPRPPPATRPELGQRFAPRMPQGHHREQKGPQQHSRPKPPAEQQQRGQHQTCRRPHRRGADLPKLHLHPEPGPSKIDHRQSDYPGQMREVGFHGAPAKQTLQPR